MKEKLTINVTAEDIEAGITCNCFRCPIAHAMMRQIPNCETVEALCSVLFYRTATPPDAVREFIEAFDSEQHVQPFSFTATFSTGEVDRDGKEQMHAI